MPTYEYKCDACGHAFEKFQPMSAAPIKKCPECGKNKVRRLIGTGAGLIFKGSGFYITDYRDKGYTDKAKAESSSGGSSTSTDAKSDAKPAEPKPAAATESKSAAAAPAPASKSAPSPKPSSKKSR